MFRLQMTWLAPLLLVALFILDVFTAQKLVLAILFNVPIALSSLTLSRSQTLWLTLAALVANALAGYINATQELTFDPIALGNRVLSALSYLLVALLSLQSARAWAQEAEKHIEEKRANQERQLRQMMEELSESPTTDALLEQTCRSVRSFMTARGVAVRSVGPQGWGSLHYQSPSTWQPPSDCPPPHKNPVRWSVLEGRMFVVAQWKTDLVLLVESPKLERADKVMAELLRSLEGLLQRAELVAHLQEHEREMLRRNGLMRSLIDALVHGLQTPLSATELEVLRGVAQGLSPQDIAQRMGTDVAVVQNHTQAVLQKLSTERNQMAIRSLRQNLL